MPPASLAKSRPDEYRRQPDPNLAAGALIRTFFSIADKWELSVDEQAAILDVSKATVYRLRQRALDVGDGAPVEGVSATTRERLEVVWDVFKGLRTFFANNKPYADRWIRELNSNTLFNGRPAL